eukprot:Clim_evm65s11 gene=Clim_evmTU65s11
MEREGIPFKAMKPDIDEKAVTIPGYENSRSKAPPEKLTVAIAHAKADALQNLVDYPALLITSDQVVSYKGTIREKPDDLELCLDYLMSYNEEPACTVSGVVVTNTVTGKRVDGVDIAKQHFKGMDREKLRPIVLANDDFMYSCGGFIVEDPALAVFLSNREGTEDSIRGMPIHLMQELLEKAQE